MSRILKSNEGYDHRFRLSRIDPNTNGNVEIIIKGRVHYPKNITIVSDEDWDEIKDFEQITSLMRKMVIQELTEVPNNFYDAMELAQRNTQLLAQKKVETEQKDRQLENKDKEIEELKKKMRDAGVPVE